MVKETEIKLRATPETLAAVQQHSLIKARQQGEWVQGTLYNQYFDTPARDLAAAKVALRLRRDGEQFIQTLKSRGQSVAGLSERNEWDWPLDQSELNLALLDDSCWPEALANLDKALLQPVFTTDFQRTKVLLSWEREGDVVEVEAALDQGRVIAGPGEEAICELELEIRQGPAAALLELALELSADLPLMPCDISKAERGYRLFDAGSYDLRLNSVEWHAETTVDQVIAGAGTQLLGHSQRLAEQYRHAGKWRLFRELTVTLTALRASFGVFDLALPRSSVQDFVQPLDQLLGQFKPLVLAGWADDETGQQAREQAAQVFDQAINDPAWGKLFIGLALWLQRRGWTLNRPPKGQRIGALSLPRWLLAAVSKEIQELKVPHTNDPDSAVSIWMDQQPRLARLYYLLSGFRGFLQVPEPDRLFGELNKLQALLEQYPQVEEEQRPLLMDALRKQGQRLRKLNAWRELNG
ncbi:CYTH domain-containing protein [Halopseudomonas pelagia]|uniref:CYTH domain-containing protein n=1 Tax=Halopseudomonas pelagia TaxID=553151 RepID=UPI0003A2BAF7|nr:CYTH domain-containing protein [Halopseudomonas pelagia]